MKTKGKFDVTLVIKYTRHVEDLYALLLAPHYKADVFTATWQLGEWVSLLGRDTSMQCRPLPPPRQTAPAHRACPHPAWMPLCTLTTGNGVPRPDVCRPPNPYAVRNVYSFRWVVHGLVTHARDVGLRGLQGLRVRTGKSPYSALPRRLAWAALPPSCPCNHPRASVSESRG